MIDLTIHDYGRTRYNELLREAETMRRIKRMHRNRPTIDMQLMLYLSKLLIAIGQGLQQRIEMRLAAG